MSEKMSGRFAEALDVNESSLGDGISSGFPIVGYRGKNWTLRIGGGSYPFLNNDGEPAAAVNVIIVGNPPNKSKSFYEGGYVEDSRSPPTCASTDGVRPDPGVVRQQNNLCDTCPQNHWYTDEQGRNKKNCDDYKRLAVLFDAETTEKMVGSPVTDPAFLRIPAASLKNLDSYGKTLKAQGFHWASTVTRISFDPAKAYPVMMFKRGPTLEDDMADCVLPLLKDETTQRILGLKGPSTPALPAPKPEEPVKMSGFRKALGAGPKTEVTHNGKASVQKKATAADTGVEEVNRAFDERIAHLLSISPD